ncbi:hypothetical protein [Thermococcus stetteri]|uniref:hypothetical protein n=1 Tax=Thermococcus stetteri TaxID=49900 RepID=UPI001AE52684|nr:hypothetical protein [Thermococcus stetteri]MBP1912500.1 putative neutral ceramidase superfamily lipid hydrolase [Thermococcus stetteri]
MTSFREYIFQAGALIGGVLYALPVVKLRGFRAEKELLLQIAAVFLPVIVVSLDGAETYGLELWVFLAFFLSIILLVLWALLSSRMLTRFEKRNLRVASWLIVAFAWLRFYELVEDSPCIYYFAYLTLFISMLFLLYSAMVAYERVSRWL